MKIGSKRFSSMFLGLFASIACAGLVHAQGVWEPYAWQGTVSLVTTGNVTYAEFAWSLGGCQEAVHIGPMIRTGTNFWYDFDLKRDTGLVICPQFVALLNTTAALGTLSPGTYTLTTTSWGIPVAINTFTVPTNSIPPTPIILPIGFGTNGLFNIQLNGVTNVNYVLQCSTNLVNWTSLSTNLSPPLLSDPSPVLPGPCYYRVQILETTTVVE